MARKRKKQQSIEKLKVKEKKARVNGSLGGDIVIFVFLCLLGAFMVFPLYYSVIQSMKPVEELFVFPPKLYVLNPTTNIAVKALYNDHNILYFLYNMFKFRAINYANQPTILCKMPKWAYLANLNYINFSVFCQGY